MPKVRFRILRLRTERASLFRGLLVISYCLIWGLGSAQKAPSIQPNVLLIMIDDLNDCIEGLNGHPQSLTPNITRLAKSGALFKKAYTNAPMCGPSRASLFTGVYPHNSGNFFQAPWFENEVLNNTKTIMEQFMEAGYQVLGTGKILHHLKRENWTAFENPADYSPSPFDGEKRVPHPDVPAPFSDIGWVDGSLGPFINLEGRQSREGKSLTWTTGNPRTGFVPMKYVDDENRDPTPDEINAKWTANQLKELALKTSNQPFFLAVGFLRPHTPLVAPKKYFDRFPLESINLTVVKLEDQRDTYLKVAYQGDVFTLTMGERMFDSITQAYGSRELGLKKWTQAYLACVAAVDDNVGEVLQALDQSRLKENTIVLLASDHGFHMGEKDYLYKNSLWEESTRIPLIIRVPGLTKAGSTINATVSLIDVYPTLLDLCGLPKSTLKSPKGHLLDGHSMRALLKNPAKKHWKGAKAALTLVYAGPEYQNNPADQHYGIRTNRFRYILYNNGREELYDHKTDPNEWNNLALDEQSSIRKLKKMRRLLADITHPYQLTGFAKLMDLP